VLLFAVAADVSQYLHVFYELPSTATTAAAAAAAAAVVKSRPNSAQVAGALLTFARLIYSNSSCRAFRSRLPACITRNANCCVPSHLVQS